jgi:hypothetical protein
MSSVLALPGARLGRMAALGAALLATLFLTASATAAPTKPFSIAFSANPVPAGVSIPGGMPAGMTIDDFTVTLRNDTKTQMLGSANLTPPTGFTLASAPTLSRGNLIEPLGNMLRLRNLNVAPGGSVTLTVDLRLPCVSGPATYAWVVEAKQSERRHQRVCAPLRRRRAAGRCRQDHADPGRRVPAHEPEPRQGRSGRRPHARARPAPGLVQRPDRARAG